jgi:hypothetical protein
MTDMLAQFGSISRELIAVAIFVAESEAAIRAVQTALNGCFACPS